MAFDKLTRWERHYLLSSIGRTHICLPLRSKVIDSLIQKSIVHGAGVVFGKYAEFSKTKHGVAVLAEFLGDNS